MFGYLITSAGTVLTGHRRKHYLTEDSALLEFKGMSNLISGVFLSGQSPSYCKEMLWNTISDFRVRCCLSPRRRIYPLADLLLSAVESVFETIFLSCVHSMADTMLAATQFRHNCGYSHWSQWQNFRWFQWAQNWALSCGRIRLLVLFCWKGISVCITKSADGAGSDYGGQILSWCKLMSLH